ncbi:hypothetical protein [Actinomadura flavalba]|uniref:hypothetical protein n=1 Tax=Actinomadura flavalba TaxID=1120938 RepID=UPI00037C76CE|nr:hypothetical protein [Actinomadura flavalba]
MLKRLIVSGLIGVAGFTAFAAPAQADDNQNTQIIGIQTCRSIDIVGIGAAIRNVLGVSDESGDCYNGSVVDKDGRHLPGTR